MSDTLKNWKPMDVPPDMSDAGWYVGTSGYYFDDWVGRFNPPKVTAAARTGLTEEQRRDQDRLRFYQKYFSFVEINNSFYREPQRDYFEDIVRRSKTRMMYAVKVHRSVSHSREKDVDEGRRMLQRHVDACGPLMETGRLYGFLIQLDDRVFRSEDTLRYLVDVSAEAVRHRADVFIEFRHISWHTRYVLQRLKDNGIGICNTEIPPLPHAFPLKAYATTDKGYVRYSGRNLDNWYPASKPGNASQRVAARNARYDYLYSPEQVRERLEGQLRLKKKVTVVAVAYNNHYQTKAIRNAAQNLALLKERM